MTEPHQSDYIDWDPGRREREGYLALPPTLTYVPITKPATKPSGQRYLLSIRAEERFGNLLAAAGAIWATYIVTCGLRQSVANADLASRAGGGLRIGNSGLAPCKVAALCEG